MLRVTEKCGFRGEEAAVSRAGGNGFCRISQYVEKI
jgi:hypothetical protein